MLPYLFSHAVAALSLLPLLLLFFLQGVIAPISSLSFFCIGEPIVYTRRQATNKRKQSSSGGIFIGSSDASKKGPGATLTPTGKGKEKTQIGVQNELHDSSHFEFERLLNFDKSLSEGEEEEGYAPLDDYIADNYVGEPIVYETSGIGEPIVYTRRQATNKRKQPPSGGIVIGSPMLLRKVQVQLQLQHQQGRVKGRLKLGFRMNCIIL
ncbi:hypothetical protein V8G54_024832 [Vigna mungo]|uniref:Uncharacterized protein n=1 Tax=Vigna mungo TaxID=3915 RepID=A0AAQ3N7X3_VIGMU